MAKKNRILRKDGTPSPFFWSDKNGGDKSNQVVYKDTDSGVKRMRGVYFDAVRKQIVKE